MKKTPMEKAAAAVLRETGWDVEEEDLAHLVDLHRRRSTAAIEKELARMTKGEHGGEPTEVQGRIDDLQVLLAARRALGRSR